MERQSHRVCLAAQDLNEERCSHLEYVVWPMQMRPHVSNSRHTAGSKYAANFESAGIAILGGWCLCVCIALFRM